MKGFPSAQNSNPKHLRDFTNWHSMFYWPHRNKTIQERETVRYHHWHLLTTQAIFRASCPLPKNSLGHFVISCLAYMWESFECLLTMPKTEKTKLRHRPFHHELIDQFVPDASRVVFFPTSFFSSFSPQVKYHLLCTALSNASLFPPEK